MVEPLMQRVAEWLEATQALEQLERARAASGTDLFTGPFLVQVSSKACGSDKTRQALL